MSSTDPDATGGPESEIDPESGLTEDDVRQYVEKLRSTPAQQILTEMMFTSLNSAQVKLGRKDARLFIDLTALMRERLGDYLPDDIGPQVDQALGQLRLAQVQAEREVAAAAEPESGDIDRAPTGIVGPADAAASEQPGSTPPSSGSSTLWVPGRDL
jgi:hypothetical protein